MSTGLLREIDRALLWKVRMMLDELQGTMGIEFVFESGTYHF